MGDTEDKRKYRIGLVLSMIGNAGEMEKEMVIAKVHVEWGLTRRDGIEIIKSLSTLGRIKSNEVNGKVMLSLAE